MSGLNVLYVMLYKMWHSIGHGGKGEVCAFLPEKAAGITIAS